MIYTSFKDLCIEIEIVEASVRQYERNKEALQQQANMGGPSKVKGIDYSQPAVVESSPLDYATYLQQLQKIESHLVLHRDRLKRLNREKKTRERKLESMEGLHYRVAYLREIKGKTLKEISEELDYSYDYIRQVSASSHI